MTVEADFRRDMAAHWRSELRAVGCKVPAKATVQEVGRMFFNVMHKAVQPRPRHVFWSAELKARTLPCDLAQGLQQFVHAAEQGENLNPNLSKRVLKADKHDLLHNDWGVRHFHLGQPGPKGFVTRTNELLFARVDPDDIYLLDVLGHDAFSAVALVEIIDRNWPHLLEPFLLKGILPSITPPTDDERQRLREVGIQPMLQINGKVYWPPGGGFATTGVSTRVMYQLGSSLGHAVSMENEAVEKANEVAAQVEKETGSPPSTIHIRLVHKGGGWKYRYHCVP